MGRRYRVALAVLGLAGLVGWFGYVLALDALFMHRLQYTLVYGLSSWALRFGWPLVVVALAGVALLQTVKDRPARGWYIAVLVVILAPFVSRGLPPRPAYLPYYLFSALYLVLTLSPRNPRRET